MNKIIHQIWLGPRKPPLWCMNSWKDYIKHNPDWSYKLWSEKDVKTLINHKIYNTEKNVRGKSDILRYEILYQYGGIFIDADSLCINPQKSLNNLVQNVVCFACREPRNKQFIANGVIYCKKGDKTMYEMIQYLKKHYFYLKKKYHKPYDIWLVTNQPHFTKICEKNNVTVYPSYYFYPESFIKNNKKIKLDTIRTKYKDSYMYQYWLSHYD